MSDDYVKPNRVFGGVAQLNSDWSSAFSTEARVRYKDYKSGQDPFTPATAIAVVCTDPVNTGSATSCRQRRTRFCRPAGLGGREQAARQDVRRVAADPLQPRRPYRPLAQRI